MQSQDMDRCLSGWYTLLERVLRMRADGLEGVGSILGVC